MVQHTAICFRCTARVNAEKGVSKFMLLPREQWKSKRPQFVVADKLITKKRSNGESVTRRPRLVNPAWKPVHGVFEVHDLNERDASDKRIFSGSCLNKSADGTVCGCSLRTYGLPEGVSPLPKRVKELQSEEKQGIDASELV